MYTGLHVKYPLFFTDVNETRILLTVFRKNGQIPKLMKIRPVGVELLRVGRQTERRTDRQTDRQRQRDWWEDRLFYNGATAPSEPGPPRC